MNWVVVVVKMMKPNMKFNPIIGIMNVGKI